MRRLLTSVIIACSLCLGAYAQELTEAQKAAAKAAETIANAPETKPEVKKPKYWTESLKTNLNIGQTGLTNWAAGGDNTFSLQGFIDGNANYKKNEMFWNNRLQLDFGVLYASSKPLLQKSTDRIYLESKWGYKTEKMKNFYFSANFDFKSQFAKGWEYKTPSVPDEYKGQYGADADQLPKVDALPKNIQKDLWKEARALKSNFLAPAYTNLALGIDYTPTKWLAVNFAPLTGGYVIVKDAQLRKAYSMKTTKAFDKEFSGYDAATADPATKDRYDKLINSGEAYRCARFEFGAQLKVDIKVNINDNFAYTTQIVLFEDYLKNHKINPCPRINWDNRFDWKIAKYFSLTLTTNLIYDDMVMIKTNKWEKKCADQAYANAHPSGIAAVQFKESLAFGFTYIIASKKN
ncbi:MAG: DUF3078 domain-containing protein [Candidatus Cryptobacteroides sp.]|nr:DUF3078 domain-containing protein [Candidatus Cryptobacteroides sp.]